MTEDDKEYLELVHDLVTKPFLRGAKIIKLRKQVSENEIHSAFLKRQNLMWKHPIMSEKITRIDKWLVQQEGVPLDILIAILARAAHVEWIYYGDADPEQKHRLLLSLRESYRQFQKLPERWQEALWPMVWGRWHAELAEEEMEEAAHG